MRTSPQDTAPIPSTPDAFTVIPTGAALGAEIRGLDVRHIDERIFEVIHSAWLDHQVLLFPGQRLTDEDLIRFSRRFGTLDHAPIQENGQRFVEGHPEIYVVSNVIEHGIAIGSLGSGEASWHTDMSYVVDPPMASVLYAIAVPAVGGDTAFATMYGAWESLPAALQRRIIDLRVKHDGTYNSGGLLREGATPSDDPRRAPGTIHPLVFTHPETGRRCLYIGRRLNSYIEGLGEEESAALLDSIWDHATHPTLTWCHHWSAGDLVLWDNRCTMHRRDGFDPASRRIMHRTQIKSGTPPASPVSRPSSAAEP
jgi:taurine dioxygenase